MVEAGDIVWRIMGDSRGLESAMNGAAQNANKQFAAISKRAGVAMTAAGAAITGALGVAVAKATSFGTAMAEVATLGVEDLKGLEQAVKDVSREYGLELVDAVKASYQAISAGASETQTPKLLAEAAKAATAGVSDLTTAIELGTSVSNAFGKSIDDVSGVYDQAFLAVKNGVTTFNELSATLGKLSPTFVAAGLSSEEMFGSVAALTKGGVATAEAVTYMSATVSAFQRQGETAKLETLGLQGALEWLLETTGGNQQEMLKFLGSTEAMKAVLALTGSQAASFTEIMGQMGNATGAAQEAFDLLVANDPAFAWRQLKAEMEVLVVEIGQNLLPVLGRIVHMVKPIVGAITDWIQAHPELASTLTLVVAAIGGLMTVLGPLLIMLPGIGVALSALSSPMLAIAGIVGGVLVGAFFAFKNYVIDNWDAIVAYFGAAWENLKLLMAAIGELFRAGFTVLSATIAGFANVLGREFDGIVGTVDWGSGSFLDILTALTRQVTPLLEWIADKAGELADWLDKHWNTIVMGAEAFYWGFIAPIAKAVEFVSWAAGMIGSAWGAIAGVFGAPQMNVGFAGPTGFASGGTVARGGWAVVGERGPELVHLPKQSTVYDAEQTRAAGGGGIHLTVNFGADSVRSDSDIDEIERRLAATIRRDLRGLGFA